MHVFYFNYIFLSLFMYIKKKPILLPKQYTVDTPIQPSGNPCVPNPCGPNSKCIEVGDTPACSCLPNFIGRPPTCRPECSSSSDCPANLACVNQKCSDPCVGACGIHTTCTVIKHNPVCQCYAGYTGDPFSSCIEIQQSM